MAIDDQPAEAPGDDDRGPVSEPVEDSPVRVGEYTWADFMAEFGHEEEIDALYPHGTDAPDDQLGLDTGRTVPRGDDWDEVSFDPAEYLGYHPDDLQELIRDIFAANANVLADRFGDFTDPANTPVIKDIYTWEHYKHEYHYDEDGNPPRDEDGNQIPLDKEEALGFDPDLLHHHLHHGGEAAMELDDVIERRTVNVDPEMEEDEFFSTADGHSTVTNRYDLEKSVPLDKKLHFVEEERYWVNKPYAFVIIFHSEKENEKKYYMIEPHLNEIEEELKEFLSGKLRTSIKYKEDGVREATDDGRREVIERETRRLLKRYDLFERSSAPDKLGVMDAIKKVFEDDDEREPDVDPSEGELEGIKARPEPILLEEDSDTLNEYQVEKLLHLFKRNFIGYERIDGIKHDINVEDISVDGYNSPVFVYHSEYEQIISNIFHGKEELDDFVVKLAQRSGKGISKRLPQVDATLPDGSRAQLTLGAEVSDHGTNYTIRQFKDVPFTPIDLINWNTFSLEEMAFLWLCIENHKSLIFAGGTASGKTTSLNAVSLFIPSNAKIVSIEDTREVELPQRNWIASVTRPSFSDDATGDIDEFDLLEAALRQRPDYIVMGEIRGEEGRTAFQVMSTGHTTYTTFHADSVDEVLKRFTTDPINVSKTMFTALDLVSIQTQTRVQGHKVRRNKTLTEINHYEAENDEINVKDVYQWQAETDEFLKMGDSNTLEEIKFDRGWKEDKLQDEIFKREVILAYLINNGLNTYAEVAATIQAFINDPDTILTLIANDQLEQSLDDLREMESVLIDVDQEKEELVPRPDPPKEIENLTMDILERAEESLYDEYRGKVPSGLGGAIEGTEEDTVEVDEPQPGEFDFGDGVETEGDAWDIGEGSTEFAFEEQGELAEAPDWADSEPAGPTESPTAEADAGSTDTAEGPSGAEFGGETTTEPETPDQEPTAEPETPAEEPTADAGTESAEGGDDIESLFGDMGSTLEELEETEEQTAEADEADEDAEADSLFPEDDIDSMFGAEVEGADLEEPAEDPEPVEDPTAEKSIDLDVGPGDDSDTETAEEDDEGIELDVEPEDEEAEDDEGIELDVEPEDEAAEEDEEGIELDVEPEDEEAEEDEEGIELDVEPEDEEAEEDEEGIELDVEPEDEATEEDEAGIELDVEPEDEATEEDEEGIEPDVEPEDGPDETDDEDAGESAENFVGGEQGDVLGGDESVPDDGSLTGDGPENEDSIFAGGSSEAEAADEEDES